MDERLKRFSKCFMPREWFINEEDVGPLFDGEVLFMWVYKEVTDDQGNNKFVVGFFTPHGEWVPESSYSLKEDAAQRVNYLNGGKGV